MVIQKAFTPTNKRFQDHTKKFVGTTTRKGKLGGGERENTENMDENGVLVRIEKAKIYDNGWEVEVGQDEEKKTYMCTNNTGMLAIPDSIESAKYYTPKDKTLVDVSIDTVSNIYAITRIRSINNMYLTFKDSNLTIQASEESDKSDNSKITVGENTVKIEGDNIQIGKVIQTEEIKGLKSLKIEGDITADNIKKIEEKLDKIEEMIKPLIEG